MQPPQGASPFLPPHRSSLPTAPPSPLFPTISPLSPSFLTQRRPCACCHLTARSLGRLRPSRQPVAMATLASKGAREGVGATAARSPRCSAQPSRVRPQGWPPEAGWAADSLPLFQGAALAAMAHTACAPVAQPLWPQQRPSDCACLGPPQPPPLEEWPKERWLTRVELAAESVPSAATSLPARWHRPWRPRRAEQSNCCMQPWIRLNDR